MRTSAGYHHCGHCDRWHGCGGVETKSVPSGGSCLLSLLGALLIYVIALPLLMMVIATYMEVACNKWPNWHRRCAEINAVSPSKLNERLKKLESSK